jgi:hypothetical protein
MRIIGALLFVLLAATPATTTAEPPQAPPSDRIGSHHDAASIAANASTAQAILAPDPIGAPNQLRLLSSTVFAEDGQQMTQFTYYLQAGTPEPSHVVLVLCMTRFVRVSGWTQIEIGYDPTTGLTGVKLDNLNGHDLTFSVIVRGVFLPGEMPYAVKAGPDILGATIGGPVCGPNAVTLSGLSAEIDGIQARKVLLVLLICAGLLVRWALKKGK